MKALLRAGVHAFSAPDTLRGAGDFLQREAHWTGFFTGHTGDTQFLFPLDLHKAEPVKPAIDCPQRAQILAKRPVHFYGQQYNGNQNPQLPQKQPAGLTPQGLICTEQRDCTEQGAGGTQIFTERGEFRKSPKQKHGTDTHKKNQHCVFSILQDVVIGQTLFLFEDGDFVQKILYQPKGTQPAADEASQQAPEHEEDAQGSERNMKTSLIQERLQRPYWARGHSSGAGIAVQSRNTGIF